MHPTPASVAPSPAPALPSAPVASQLLCPPAFWLPAARRSAGLAQRPVVQPRLCLRSTPPPALGVRRPTAPARRAPAPVAPCPASALVVAPRVRPPGPTQPPWPDTGRCSHRPPLAATAADHADRPAGLQHALTVAPAARPAKASLRAPAPARPAPRPTASGTARPAPWAGYAATAAHGEAAARQRRQPPDQNPCAAADQPPRRRAHRPHTAPRYQHAAPARQSIAAQPRQHAGWHQPGLAHPEPAHVARQPATAVAQWPGPASAPAPPGLIGTAAWAGAPTSPWAGPRRFHAGCSTPARSTGLRPPPRQRTPRSRQRRR